MQCKACRTGLVRSHQTDASATYPDDELAHSTWIVGDSVVILRLPSIIRDRYGDRLRMHVESDKPRTLTHGDRPSRYVALCGCLVTRPTHDHCQDWAGPSMLT